MDSAAPPPFPLGLRHTLTHRVTGAELAPVAALIGSSDPALSSRAAATLMTRLLVSRFPGPGTLLRREDFRFAGRLAEGDQVELTVEVAGTAGDGSLVLHCSVRQADGTAILEGTAEVTPPAAAPTGTEAPFGTQPRRMIATLLARCAGLPPVPTAVVHPCDVASLDGAMLAARHGLIRPILVGPPPRIRAAAETLGIDLAGVELVATPHSHASAEAAVALVGQGRAAALMKGSLHTDELMSAALAREAGLRTERRVSHAFVMDAPLYPRLLIITDAAVNITPDLEAKADIVRNAIDLAVAIGIDLPRVALLSAVETVTPKLASTIDAAALCKMAERGQIMGGILDGPLAFDNAVSEEAARAKGIVSAVAGRADILVVPDIESGNMLAKQLAHLGGAEGAGIVLGLRVPMALTSRSDDATSRLASAALLRLVAAR
ncbi:bifunctional enoyl-CoA hydratase/phosphate acetyltransferase [Falsiroseomonas oryzae]|uniref:bifunctional enoyl-CoA hydratase/phosphate acetyltransferase n=1 Tax=Falsiroseomonas oryzae TaxID=2766473 RepID=UPI0022EB843D|nr:bifunctional enoyl-CoA hydratase/phosphate acetyltransferase [Roseomonas sp. MO-31]